MAIMMHQSTLSGSMRCTITTRRAMHVTCGASKTTRGRSTTSGTSSSGTTSSSSSTRSASSSQPATELDGSRKSTQDRLQGLRQRLDSLVHHLTPKQEGDFGDVLMMSLSMAVFVYLAMQMYRMYYYIYLQMGIMDMMQ